MTRGTRATLSTPTTLDERTVRPLRARLGGARAASSPLAPRRGGGVRRGAPERAPRCRGGVRRAPRVRAGGRPPLARSPLAPPPRAPPRPPVRDGDRSRAPPRRRCDRVDGLPRQARPRRQARLRGGRRCSPRPNCDRERRPGGAHVPRRWPERAGRSRLGRERSVRAHFGDARVGRSRGRRDRRHEAPRPRARRDRALGAARVDHRRPERPPRSSPRRGRPDFRDLDARAGRQRRADAGPGRSAPPLRRDRSPPVARGGHRRRDGHRRDPRSLPRSDAPPPGRLGPHPRRARRSSRSGGDERRPLRVVRSVVEATR